MMGIWTKFMVNQPAPDIPLTTLVSERTVDRATCAGRPVLLLFQDPLTARVAQPFQETVRRVYPDASKLVIASIVDLSSVPSFARAIARKTMAVAYQQALRQVPAKLPNGLVPEEYILLLPDWRGDVVQAFRVRKFPTVVLLDREWREVARSSAGALGEQVVGWLENVDLQRR